MSALMRISMATLTAGLIMLALGTGPLWLAGIFMPGADLTLFGVAFLMLTPTGGIVAIIGAIMVIFAVIRDHR